MVSLGIKVNVIYEWKYAEYEWENPKQKKCAIESGIYDPYDAVIHDIEKANDGRIFVSVPKILGPGIPATLAIVTNKTGPGGPLLRPYPNWNWYNSSCMCDNIISTYQVHVFMADSGGSGIVIYDSSKRRICRVESDYMKPTDSSFSIAGENFTYEGGIMDLYYAAVSGKEIYKINVKTLLNCPNKKKANKQTKLVVKMSSQTPELTSMGYSIFYGLTREMSILGTNVYKEFGNNTVRYLNL
ncbi:Major royal jelly protein 5 [Cyphomyrmex costatus]|uniref:Major royal jelly protein 5 n=1 Tax=Cyphomyrmex costatus TaxID=456900 RepID=A0A195C8Y7_9HYME|nr:Major royal jelly protein 5 [Cyphomyrmex costatus]